MGGQAQDGQAPELCDALDPESREWVTSTILRWGKGTMGVESKGEKPRSFV